MSVLNVINQLLAYEDDVGSTNNPNKRAFDWTRQLANININNPSSDKKLIPPGGSFTIFDGYRTTDLDGTSILGISLLSSSDSVYELAVSAGPSGFRTARAVSGISGAAVTVNNNSVATFVFAAATLTAVQVGDTMRIKGAALYDDGPFAFNAANAGDWTVIAVSGTSVQVVRPLGEDFVGVNESPSAVSGDVQFYSADGVQAGDKLAISGVFSFATQRTYVVTDVTPSTIQFVSSMPLPEESGLTNVPGNVVVYTASKRLVYLEVDQDSVIRFNTDVSDNTKVSPIVPGDTKNVGYMHKWGESYKCVVVNKSISPLNLRFLLGE